MDFTGKVAIVTGASVGMGRETAKLLAEHGAKVVVNYVSAETDAEATVQAIRDSGGNAVACREDVSDPAAADRLVAAAVKEFGRLDVLINNAGVTRFVPFADLDALTPEVWTRLYEINVMGAFFCARAAAKAMNGCGARGVIVNNASIAGHRPNGSSIAYCTSKAALLHLTRLLAVALKPIRVNSVSPGYIDDTRWNTGRENFDGEKARLQAADDSLLGRVGSAMDLAQAMVWLASDQSSFITGQDILADGGRCYCV